MRFLFLLLFTLTANAATYCVGPSATGDSSGSDWDNIRAFSGTATRGDTWYLADGAYTARKFDTAKSGTTRITIKKAIPSDHVTDTGWNDTMGDGQAVITGESGTNDSDAGYLTFDGQRGDYATSVAYGIKFANSTAGAQSFNFDLGGDHSILRYCEFAGPGDDQQFNHTSDTGCLAFWGEEADDTLVQYCYLHGGSTLLDGGDDNCIFEHSYLKDSLSSNGNAHSNVWFCSGVATNRHFRYNKVSNYNDEGVFVTGVFGEPDGVYVYGNTFTSPGTVNPRGVECRQDFSYLNIYVYNNTFVDLSAGGVLERTGESDDTITGECKNNICVNAGIDPGTGAWVVSDNTDDSDESRFTNYAGGDFTLTAGLAGVSLGSPYDTDMLGNTRGGDGTWDRGAFEFGTPSGGTSTFSGSGQTTIGSGSGSTTFQ